MALFPPGILTLPNFVVFYSESAGKYLNCHPDSAYNAVHVMGEHVWNPNSRFEAVQSKVHPTMTHIRCCYNNKFLRRPNPQPDATNVYAVADEPEDDQTIWSSTLFQPEFLGGGAVRLLHFQLGLYAQWEDVDGTYTLKTNSATSANSKTLFRFIDWESLVALPRHLTFRGDNMKYLGLVVQETGAALRFEIDDLADKSIVHEVVPLPDGTFRIKNVSQGAFWRLDNANSDDNIFADDLTTAITTPATDSVFRAEKVNDNTIALRSRGNDMYCKRYTSSHIDNGLSANTYDITQQYVHLALTELVTSRRIEDMAFDLAHGWIDETSNIILNPGEEVRNETDQTRTINTRIYYTDTATASTWTSINNSSLKLGPVVEIQPNRIPYVTDSSTIDTMAPYQTSYVWGETTTKNSKEFRVHQVVLQAWSMVTVKLQGTLGTCHVPIAYTRYDEIDGGQVEAYTMDDGVYTGTNYVSFAFEETEPKPIARKN